MPATTTQAREVAALWNRRAQAGGICLVGGREGGPTRVPDVSIVIPTKDRPDLLRRCVSAVLNQSTNATFEVIVVNDAGCPIDTDVTLDGRATVVDAEGAGPAAARNVGVARAAGEIVLFTDDDAIPQEGWIEAAVAALARFPKAVGVAGPVESLAFDPLYEHSVSGQDLGNFLTCNVAYRRDALKSVGVFDTGFPYPAAEDRDLGYRMQAVGDVWYERQMVVVHPPRPIGVIETARQGRYVRSEWRLHYKHPQTRPPRWSVRWGPIIRMARRWQRLLFEDRVVHGSPRRAVRFSLMAGGQLLVALVVTLQGASVESRPRAASAAGGERRLRLAWVGAVPERGGGVAGCAWLLVDSLSRRGCDVDCYAGGPHGELRESFASLPGVRLVNVDTGWRYDRWYSRHSLTKLLTGFGARATEQRRLGRLLLEQHRLCPYDAVYQFSNIEVFGMRRHLDELPPLFIHPETHIAGELRWFGRERPLAANCGPLWQRSLVECVLIARARRQERDIHFATGVGAISRRFGQDLVDDYGVDPRRLTLIRNPVDLHELRTAPRRDRSGPWRLAFVGRMSVRKGVELVVALSHRLGDLEGDVILDLVGGHTLWSDYRPLLKGLNPRLARYRGYMSRREIATFLAQTDILLQPAKYEPFGLTVAEALASGVPVVVSDAVGAAEDVSPECCTVVPAGDIDALEQGVRAMLSRLQRGDGPEISHCARAEAERLFSPDASATCALAMLASARASA